MFAAAVKRAAANDAISLAGVNLDLLVRAYSDLVNAFIIARIQSEIIGCKLPDVANQIQ